MFGRIVHRVRVFNPQQFPPGDPCRRRKSCARRRVWLGLYSVDNHGFRAAAGILPTAAASSRRATPANRHPKKLGLFHAGGSRGEVRKLAVPFKE